MNYVVHSPLRMRRSRQARYCFMAALAFSVGVLLAPSARAEKPKPPERVRIDTSDGVRLVGDYYEAAPGRDTQVAVLLADEGESRAVFHNLAKRMQDPPEGKPCSVLAIDLRGQGDSTLQRLPSRQTRNLSGDKVSRNTIGAMVHIDMEAVRGFLVDKNDAGELNLNRLTYLGVGMGAVVAVNAAAVDWSQPTLNTGKQGQDVKSVVLVSPPWRYKAVGILDALRQPGVASQVAVLMMYGDGDQDSVSSVERIVNQLERARGKQPPADEDYLPTVLDAPGRSSLKGTPWLKQAGAGAENLIVQFLQEHVAAPEYPWAQRRLD